MWHLIDGLSDPLKCLKKQLNTSLHIYCMMTEWTLEVYILQECLEQLIHFSLNQDGNNCVDDNLKSISFMEVSLNILALILASSQCIFAVITVAYMIVMAF